MKPAYKLQEFVAHTSNVNCLKIGKKSSRVLVTGGEDHKVNIWAIGKPNAILSLSGHSSAVESVAFDAAEVLVLAGAASGTIKLWDLEEAKIVRTLTGHRSNCITVDFHPFGEFFASGSLDTNLKIWDIRRKGCIHTYKGHTRGINAIKFSPDGRWVVSGGEDNVVKLWDLTAGKLMHDFKHHDGQITCLDFHPHEFLLATGSADRTVRFWDLETFESIGSAGPEAGVVRSLIFNADGRTLLCGLHESLKIFSWEPIRYHDVVDVGWSKLVDLSVHEGRLLGCSFNQSCVGIWVVDLSRVGPVSANSNTRSDTSCCKSVESISQTVKQVTDGSLKSGSAIKNYSPCTLESSLNDIKLSADNIPSTPQRVFTVTSTKGHQSTSTPTYVVTPRRAGASRIQSVSSIHQQTNITDMASTALRTKGVGLESTTLEANSVKVAPLTMHSKDGDVIKPDGWKGFAKDALKTDLNCSLEPVLPNQKSSVNVEMGNCCCSSEPVLPNLKSSVNAEMGSCCSMLHPDTSNLGSYATCEFDTEYVKLLGSGKFRRTASAGAQRDPVSRTEPRTHSLTVGGVVAHPEHDTILQDSSRGGCNGNGKLRTSSSNHEMKDKAFGVNMGGMIGMRASLQNAATFLMPLKGNQSAIEILDDAIVIKELTQQHGTLMNTMQSRLAKFQVVRRFWIKNDMKGAVEAMGKMADNAVLIDVLSVLVDNSDVFTLETCTLLLPLLNGLLSSHVDRYLTTALAVLSLLVRNFGNIIHTTRTASPSFGVDLHAELRLERCNLCFAELQNVAQSLVPLLRKGGEIGRASQDLSIALQEV